MVMVMVILCCSAGHAFMPSCFHDDPFHAFPRMSYCLFIAGGSLFKALKWLVPDYLFIAP
jgi:hypothetical protein